MPTNTSGTQDPYKMVDPNGMQTGATASAALAFCALSASEAGDTVASALGLSSHSSPFATAGLSLASLGRLDLFTVGLILVGLSVILNVASLVTRWQYSRSEPREPQA
jgi:hypothetical protein